jgi:hypothetical protein
MINDMTITYADYRAEIIDEIIPRAAGVQIFPYLFDLTKTFGFSNQLIYFGFGVGILARMINSNIPPISIANTPTITFDFMTPGVMPSVITFTRTTTARYFDDTGAMKTAAINQPRWDYDPITHVLKGLLLEDVRTNLALYSDRLNSNWTVSQTSTGLNAGVAPDGTTTATKLVENATTSIHYYAQYSVPLLASTQYTFSIFVKAAENRYLQISFDNNSAGGHTTFDLQTGTISGPSALHGSGAILGTPPSSIQDVGNGWYRCVITNTIGTTVGSPRIMLVLVSNSMPNSGFAPSYVGTAGNGVLIWGAQMELGDYVTSYITTPAGTATARAVDSCQINPANMSWYNGDGGSWVIEFTLFDQSPANTRIIGRPNTGGTPGAMTVGTTRILGQYDGVGCNAPGTIPINTYAKGATTWQPGSLAKSCLNGGAVNKVTNMTIGYSTYATNGLRFISTGAGTDSGSGYLKNVRYWKEILTDNDMMLLTAPGAP